MFRDILALVLPSGHCPDGMSDGCFFTALDNVLDTELHPVVDFKSLTGLDLSLKRALYDEDFVCFFLDFLRESASRILSSQSNEAHEKTVAKSANISFRQPGGKINHMVVKPKAKTQEADSLRRRTSPRTQDCVTPRSDQGKHFRQSRREPIHLTDFMVRDLKPAQQNSQRKKAGRKGKRANTIHSPEGFRGDNLSSDTNSRSKTLFGEEDFPSLSNAAPEISSKPSRRIKPTLIEVGGHAKTKRIGPTLMSVPGTKTSMKGASNVGNPFLNGTEADVAENERDLLLKMKSGSQPCANMLGKESPAASVVADDDAFLKSCRKTVTVEQVYLPEKLHRLCALYCHYLNTFLVPSFVSELQFVIDLLICGLRWNAAEEFRSDVTAKQTSPHHALLANAANCVYFAAHAIQSLTDSGFISVLNCSTLSFLSQNQGIQTFLPTLPSQLQTLVSSMERRGCDGTSSESYQEEQRHRGLSSVIFDADTDDRSNFSTDGAFHSFRKHRDFFYVILREYEERKHDPNFRLQEHLYNKIHSIVKQVLVSGTCRHFVRLFVNQMLQEVTSGCRGDSDPGLAFANKADILVKFRQGDPEKFKRLQSRFFGSSAQNSNKDRDVLLDSIFFYKEFVLCADNHSLNTHLCNEIWNRISDAETVQVQLILGELLAESVDIPSVTSSLTRLISSVRLLGHLLGSVVFGPYGCDGVSTDVTEFSVFDRVLTAIHAAAERQHALVTIPWAVEYLRGATSTPLSGSAKLAAIIETLFSVLRKSVFLSNNALSTGQFYMVLLVSNLSETIVQPGKRVCGFVGLGGSEFTPSRVMKMDLAPRKRNEASETSTFDSLCAELITCTAIYDSFPATREMTTSILTCNTGSSKASQTPSRKIKPSTEKEPSVAEKKEKQVQRKLEEHFFRGQPSSLKRTVEFVSERCASNCVKQIRSVSMLGVCDQAEEIFRVRLREGSVDLSNHSSRVPFIRDIVEDVKACAGRRMRDECDQFCSAAVTECLRCLSSCETAPEVVQLATTIATRKSKESVRAWLSSRLDELVSMSVKARLTKIATSLTTVAVDLGKMEITDFVGACEDCAVPDITSISSLLQVMKEYCVRMTFKKENGICSQAVSRLVPADITRENVAGLLKLADSLLQQRLTTPDYKLMAEVLKCSPHLKSSISLACRELSARALTYF